MFEILTGIISHPCVFHISKAQLLAFCTLGWQHERDFDSLDYDLFVGKDHISPTPYCDYGFVPNTKNGFPLTESCFPFY